MLNKYFNSQRYLFFILLLCLFLQVQGETQFTINSLKDIDACEGKIKLTLVYVWGDDDTEDINQVFRLPSDIKIDSMGRIYIVDYGNNRIQVFDKSRQFIRTIGVKGKGPADLLNPKRVAFTSNNNIAVLDTYNFRIQVFNPEGRYINSFRTGPIFLTNLSIFPGDRILLYLPKKNEDKKWAFFLYDLKGNFIKDFYTIPCKDTEYSIKTSEGIKKFKECSEEPISYLVDDKGDIFLSYRRIPVFQKLSNNGKLLRTVTYEVPFKSFKISLSPGNNGLQLSSNDSIRIDGTSAGFTINRQGSVFLTAYARRMQKSEGIVMVGNPGDIKRVLKDPENFPEKTDLYRLLVFNAKGQIIASKKLSVFCDQIYVYNDRLFIIDQFREMKIYEYKFEL